MIDTVLSRRELVALGAASAAAPALRWLPRPGSFAFAFFSDTHLGVGGGNLAANRERMTEIAASAPAFAVNGGDVTDYGWASEYDAYARVLEGVRFPVHHVPGNHDVRWAPRGLQIFRERVGAPYQLFEHEGAWFVLLDSTVPLSHYGHYESAQLRQLERDLRRVGRGAPVFVFTHHWVGRDPVMVDNAQALAAVLEPYNVRMVFNGHGHSDLLWEWHGVTSTMNRGLYQGSWQRVEVDREAGEVRLLRRTTETPTLTGIATVPLAAPREKRQVWALGAAALSSRAEIGGGTTAADSRLHPRWAERLSGGVMSHLRLADGVLYVSAMDGSVSAHRTDNGRPIWWARTEGYCHSSPVADGGRVIVGSADGHVYAFDGRTGRRRWRTRTGGPVYASAAIAQGVAAIASGDGLVYGLDPATGAVRWRFALPASNASFVQSPAATDGTRIFFGAWDRHVYALDAATGALAWRTLATERSFAYSAAIARPAVGGGVVYIPANGNVLHALDAATGATRWTFTSPGDKVGYSSPALVDGRIYIGCLGPRGEVRCLSAADGREIWTAATGTTIYDSSPAVADGYVSVGSVDGTLWLLAAEDGRIAGSHRLPPGHLLASPAAGDGSVYAASLSDVVMGFTLAS